tara:strand:- start:41294 stop:43843 length:2550 start_codon:yes stop_codon:yes gene_type:complete
MLNKIFYIFLWLLSFSAFSQNNIHNFDLPAQPLDLALTTLSRQTDMPIIFSYDKVHGFMTQPIHGPFLISDALLAILFKTGLKATITGNGIIVISTINEPKLTAEKPSASIKIAEQGLEVIHVTSSKRLSDIQKLPDSIVVLSGESLASFSNLTLEDASRALPLVNISQAQAAENIFIRGVGSGVNQGFEQSVGLFIDGVYFGRGRSARSQLFDLARVEIIKGPQATLYGKNTVAGVINIVNELPSFDTQGYVTSAYEFVNNGKKIEGVFTAPLSDTVAFRIGTRWYKTDGYLKNSFTHSTQPAKDEGLLRASLLWQEKDKFDLNFKLELADAKIFGRPTQLTKVSPLTEKIQLDADPLAEFSFDYQGSNTGTGPIFSRQHDASNSYNSTMNINYYADKYTLTTTTGLYGYQYVEFSDSDSLSVGYLQQERDSNYTYLGQEIRLASTSFNDFEYMFGVHINSEVLEHTKLTNIDTAVIPEVLNRIVTEYQIPAEALTATREQNFEQKNSSYAVFVDTTFDLTEKLRLNTGLRWTNDKKRIDKSLIFNHLGSNQPHALANEFLPILDIGVPHKFTNLHRKEAALSGGLGINYQSSSKVLWYTKYSRGFKAGGFDEDNIKGLLTAQEFDKETVNAFEMGLKSSFNQDRVRLNIALFHSTFSDLQVSTFDGNSSFNVGNAASATNKGLESDLFIKLPSELDLHLSVGLLDASYDEFIDGPSLVGGSTPRDLSGRNLQYSPDVTIKLNVSKGFSFFGLMDAKFELNAFYTSRYDIPGDLDPVLAQSSYIKLDSKLQLFIDESRWEIALIGKNITNRKTTSWGNDVPSSQFLGSSYFQFIDPPRTIMLQATKLF